MRPLVGSNTMEPNLLSEPTGPRSDISHSPHGGASVRHRVEGSSRSRNKYAAYVESDDSATSRGLQFDAHDEDSEDQYEIYSSPKRKGPVGDRGSPVQVQPRAGSAPNSGPPERPEAENYTDPVTGKLTPESWKRRLASRFDFKYPRASLSYHPKLHRRAPNYNPPTTHDRSTAAGRIRTAAPVRPRSPYRINSNRPNGHIQVRTRQRPGYHSRHRAPGSGTNQPLRGEYYTWFIHR
ncbi:hypothetical protein GGS20DRAFT_334494 [Poronia punctata]|nr:hypothetical protein GGS20DRAFT_334494 [Poronia punctata]